VWFRQAAIELRLSVAATGPDLMIQCPPPDADDTDRLGAIKRRGTHR